jgi:hypothetical protein
VCRKEFAARAAAVDQLGVCIRLRDTISLLFPEQLAARRAEVQQEEARKAAAALAALRAAAARRAALAKSQQQQCKGMQLTMTMTMRLTLRSSVHCSWSR